MAKLKSFEQFLSEMDRTEEVQQDVVATAEPVEQSEEKAEEVQGNGEAIEEGRATIDPSTFKDDKLNFNDQFRGNTSLSQSLASDLGFDPKKPWSEGIGFDDQTMYSVGKPEGDIENKALSGKFTYAEEVVAESNGEEAGLPAEDLKDETKEVDNDVEAPEDKSKELEAELEDTVDGAGAEEISEAEEVEETEEVEEEEEAAKVSDLLQEVYESCKNEAKVWADDAHDEHTVETYMKENAALVGALAAKTLKEMKEDYSVEAYEAACNEMIEAYSKKVNEMKESDSAVGEETPEA